MKSRRPSFVHRSPLGLSMFASGLVLAAACGAPTPKAPAAPVATAPSASSAPAQQPAPAAAASAAPPSASPASPAVKALIDAGLASRHGAEIVRSLTDEVGPRLAGSAGDKAAVAWGLARLKAEGLVNVHAEAVKVPHWERGAESGALVSPSPQKLALTAIGGSIGTAPGGLEAEVVEVASLEAIDALDAKAVAGKIVFYNTIMERAKDGKGYGNAVGIRVVGAKRAALKGAVGVVIRSVGTDDNRLPHTGTLASAEKGERSIPAAALSIPDAEMLHRTLAEKKTVRLRMTLGCKMLPDGDSANVVGDIPGAVHPDEIVLLGAHLDSWDLGTGALDDGAGIGIVVEAARLILASGVRPARTLRVVLFANEENGLAGGTGYAKAHAGELAKHIVGIEADIGTDKVLDIRYGGAPEQRDAFNALADALKPLGIARSDKDGDGGSDLSPMRAAGVPTLSLAQDASRYFDIHHTANDTFDKINAENLAQAATAYAIAAQTILGMSGDFGRVPPEKRERHH